MAPIVILLLSTTGCIRMKYEPLDSDADLFVENDGDSSDLYGTLEDQQGMVSKIPVTVSRDLEAVMIEIDGDRLQLAKSGSGEKCKCTFYRNDSYAVMVEFSGQKATKAKVLRLFAEDEEVIVSGSLTDASGISVKIPISIGRDKNYAQFLYEGEDITLPWDGKIDPECECRTYRDTNFEIRAWFPSEKVKGKALIKRFVKH